MRDEEASGDERAGADADSGPTTIADRVTWLLVYGTRPEVVKCSPLKIAADKAGFPLELLCTGQHTDLLTATADTLRHQAFVAASEHLPPVDSDPDPPFYATNLGIEVADWCEDRGISGIMVQGDTCSAYAGALAADLHHLPLAHVEAGVRSGNLEEPYPEEGFRRQIDRWATYHFAPTDHCAQNLEAEGIHGAIVTGNTGIDDLKVNGEDTLLMYRALGAVGGVLITLHRRETWDRLPALVQRLEEVAGHHPGVQFLWPAHPSPKVQAAAARCKRIQVVPAMGLSAFRIELAHAQVVLTDSGGVQEEAAHLGIPCLIARNVTDRPESVLAGVAKVVGTDPEVVAGALHWELAYAPLPKRPMSVFGDGKAADRIIAALSVPVLTAA